MKKALTSRLVLPILCTAILGLSARTALAQQDTGEPIVIGNKLQFESKILVAAYLTR